MRNREFQIRTVRRAILAEIAKGYYRPERPNRNADIQHSSNNHCGGRLGIHHLADNNSAQLTLDFDPPQPLADIFPEAYEL
jgi:hypothetical protein